MSEILIQQYKMKSYKELKEFISKKIDEGEMFLSLDIKPNFDDTSTIVLSVLFRFSWLSSSQYIIYFLGEVNRFSRSVSQ